METARHPDRDHASLDRETLLARLREAEETLEAIRQGAVDAVVVTAEGASKVFTLQGADHGPRRDDPVLQRPGRRTAAAPGTRPSRHRAAALRHAERNGARRRRAA